MTGSRCSDAAREGASGRLRAILMTAAAMIFGMMPDGHGLFGEGGSPSTPLGRAVIGGLIVSTFATLTILPSIYAILQSQSVRRFSVRSIRWTPRADTMKRTRSPDPRAACAVLLAPLASPRSPDDLLAVVVAKPHLANRRTCRASSSRS